MLYWLLFSLLGVFIVKYYTAVEMRKLERRLERVLHGAEDEHAARSAGAREAAEAAHARLADGLPAGLARSAAAGLARLGAGVVEAGLELAEDKSVRAVVLSGEGRAFCAGLDFSSFQAMAGDGERQRDSSVSDILANASDSPANLASARAGCGRSCPSR